MQKEDSGERERRRVLENPRFPFVILVGEDAKEQPKKLGIINTEQNPSHYNNNNLFLS